MYPTSTYGKVTLLGEIYMYERNDETEIIFGLNPVKNALKGRNKVKKLLVLKTRQEPSVLELAKEANVEVEFVEKTVLERVSDNRNHQGFIAILNPYIYADLGEIIKSSKTKPNSLIVMLDGIEDPVNLGSLIRTSSCFGVDGLIIAKRRQVQVTATVSKIATGAEQYLPIARVTNLASTIDILKKEGYWIVAADGSGTTLYNEINYSGKMVIVVGGEGQGVSNLVLKRSDFVAKIPIGGPITSLNASIAGAIFIAEARQYQLKK